LPEQIRQTVADLEDERLSALLGEFLASAPDEERAREVLAACQQGMELVGERFGAGAYFVGDLVTAGSMLAGAVERLKPLLGFASGDAASGTLVLGTVEGDIHDIGKNIYKALSEAAGFKVVDIGIDQKPEAFVEAVKESGAELVGLSGVLTLSIASMKNTVEALEAAGLKGKVKVLVGGAPITQTYADEIGADGTATNAASAAELAKQLVS